jgi:hypothetical protein
MKKKKKKQTPENDKVRYLEIMIILILTKRQVLKLSMHSNIDKSDEQAVQ